MNSGKLILALVISTLVFFNPTTVDAANFADYFPLTLGSYWTYQNAENPTLTQTDSVFEEFVFGGNSAMKVGSDSNNYTIAYNDGTSVNIYGSVSEDVLTDFDDVSIADFTDGAFFNLAEPTNFVLLRMWDNLDPTLKSIYGIDPSLTDLVL